MKSIRFITTNAGDWGGSEVLWQQAAMKFSTQGHRVEISVPSGCYERYSDRLHEFRASGISVNRFWRGESNPVQRVLKKVKHVFTGSTESSRHFDVNIISQGNLTEGLATLQCVNASRQRVIIVIQLVAEFQWPSDSVARQLATEFRNADLICFVSENNLRLAEKQLGPLPNAIVVRNPFSVPFNSDSPFPHTSHGHVLASVARLHAYHKGQDLLVDVFDCEKWKSRDLTVHLFGDGPHKESLQHDITRRGLARKIILRGHQVDVAGIWRECHGLLLCSRIEGLPLALVEAMLSARCPIVTSVGGAEELVEDGSTGFLAKGATVHDIDDALERAWARRSEWHGIGLAAAKKVRSDIPQDPAAVFCDQILRRCDLA